MMTRAGSARTILLAGKQNSLRRDGLPRPFATASWPLCEQSFSARSIEPLAEASYVLLQGTLLQQLGVLSAPKHLRDDPRGRRNIARGLDDEKGDQLARLFGELVAATWYQYVAEI